MTLQAPVATLCSRRPHLCSDGDTLCTTFDAGSFALTGGTGNSKGRSGGGTYTMSYLAAPGPAPNVLIIEHRISWLY